MATTNETEVERLRRHNANQYAQLHRLRTFLRKWDEESIEGDMEAVYEAFKNGVESAIVPDA